LASDGLLVSSNLKVPEAELLLPAVTPEGGSAVPFCTRGMTSDDLLVSGSLTMPETSLLQAGTLAGRGDPVPALLLAAVEADTEPILSRGTT
jgi:hypothetical protein